MKSSQENPSNGNAADQASPLLEWTGERYVPWISDPAIAYEHLHRYAFASRLTAGKHVLDLASGEGYGANILAAAAARVVGIEIDEGSIRHARCKYARDNLEFMSGSVTNVPLKAEHAFDVAVCFEAIEHIVEQEKLVAEANRMLKPEGVFVVSTPNKRVYQDEAGEDNPFHVRELDFDQFRALLGSFFNNIAFFGQRIYGNSNIWPISPVGGRIEESVIARGAHEFEFVNGDKREPMYFIAIASNSTLPQDLSGSVLIDASDQLLKETQREIRELLEAKDSNENAIAWLERQVSELTEGVEWCQGQIRALTEGHAWKDKLIQDARATIAANDAGIEWLRSVVENLEAEKGDLIRRLQDAAHQLELIHGSRGWRLLVWLQRLRGKK